MSSIHGIRLVTIILFNFRNERRHNSDSGRGGDAHVSVVVGSSGSPTRVLCSALMLPTMSTLLGKLLFSSARSNLHRAALGGLTFLLLRGAVTIYHKQKLLIRQSSRKILDYSANNLKLYTNRVYTDCTGTPPPTN